MTEEPIYQYIKGQGWVVTSGLVVKDRNGKMIRLEKRPPKDGEYWFSGYGTDEEHDYRNMDHVIKYTLEEFPVWVGPSLTNSYSITLVVV